MKQIAYCLLFLLTLGQTTFAQSRKEQDEKNTFEYAEGVSFTVRAAQHSRSYGGNQNSTYVAEKGYSFVMLVIDFKNESDTNAELDFSNFSILDQAGKKYEIMGAIQSMKISSTDQNFTYTLKAGKDKRYVLAFKPYPKDQLISKLIRGEEIFTLSGIK